MKMESSTGPNGIKSFFGCVDNNIIADLSRFLPSLHIYWKERKQVMSTDDWKKLTESQNIEPTITIVKRVH